MGSSNLCFHQAIHVLEVVQHGTCHVHTTFSCIHHVCTVQLIVPVPGMYCILYSVLHITYYFFIHTHINCPLAPPHHQLPHVQCWRPPPPPSSLFFLCATSSIHKIWTKNCLDENKLDPFSATFSFFYGL